MPPSSFRNSAQWTVWMHGDGAMQWREAHGLLVVIADEEEEDEESDTEEDEDDDTPPPSTAPGAHVRACVCVA
jgi:hypothetical protein